MEQKNLKTSIVGFDTVFSESAECPIDVDFTLPDYYAEISKILKCCATARVSSKGINGNTISIEGTVTLTVIYCGSDKSINSYEYQYPFSKSFDIGANEGNSQINVKTKCEYINCRAVTGRKIDIHGAVGIYVDLLRRCVTEVVSDCDCRDIELLRDSVPATIPLGNAEKYLIMDEEIELGAGQPDIRCIIRYDADATVTESKIMAGKSMVKGELLLKLLYAPADNATPQTVRCKLPFGQLIEIDGISEDCECDSKVCIAHIEVKPRVSASGECRNLILNAKLLITSTCCCNNDVGVITDAYSRKYEAEVLKNMVCFNKIVENVNSNFSCKKKFEFGSDAISSITDMWCDTRIDTVKFCDNAMRISGVVSVYIIAQDSTCVPTFYEKMVDFEYAYPISIEGEYKSTPKITVTGVNYTFVGENEIELRIELNVCAAVYKCCNLPIITDIKVNDKIITSKKSDAAMTLYFASEKEKIWDIARKYSAGIEEIKQINDITEEILTVDKMILIPNN